MKKINYKESEKYDLSIFKDSSGYTVMKNPPIVNVRKSHGQNYPQFFHKNLETAYHKMIKWITNEKTS